jgi:hypothetical protein
VEESFTTADLSLVVRSDTLGNQRLLLCALTIVEMRSDSSHNEFTATSIPNIVY